MFFLSRTQAVILLYLFAFTGCSSGLLRKEVVESFNEKLAKKHFIARKNIYVAFSDKKQRGDILFSKGSKLRIVVERGEDWLKVRAFSIHEDEEQSQGKVILFIARSLLASKEKKSYSLASLQKSLDDLLKEFPFSDR